MDLERDLYLRDHRLDGRPVLPFAVALELMAEVAAAGWPDREVIAVRHVRLLRGIHRQAPDDVDAQLLEIGVGHGLLPRSPAPPYSGGEGTKFSSGAVPDAGGQASARNCATLRAAIAIVADCGFTPGASGRSEASLTRRFR